MLNVPSEIQAVIKNDATLKNFRVHFPNGERADLTNENIVFESVSFTESVCSGDTFRFGLAEASVIEFETVGVENIVGLTIECSMEFKVPSNLVETYGEWYSIPYGTFVIDSCPRNHEDMTHRKVVGYSALKNELAITTFLQKRILPVPDVRVPLNSLIAYYTNDVSKFSETVSEGTNAADVGRGGVGSLFTSDGRAVNLHLDTNSKAALKQSYFSFGISSRSDSGYILEYEETGAITNEEFGREVVRQFEEITSLDVRYDPSGKRIFETNEEAIRFAFPALFHPSESRSVSNNNLSFRYQYRGQPIEIGKFMPLYYDSQIESEDYSGFACWLVGNTGGQNVKLRISINGANFTGNTITVSGFSANAVFKRYSPNGNEFGFAKFKNTLVIANSFISEGLPSSSYKYFYGNMYAYSNAFSNRDMMAGIAELNGAFVHSERNGDVSIEPLNNSNPYQLSLSDIEDNVWWDEYDVSPIGTIRYTFLNPSTGQVEKGEYVVNNESKSIYDLSGNKFLESIDFSIYKAATAEKMNKRSLFYLYTGSESGYVKNNLYFHNGTEWVSGGAYNDVTSIVEFVLDNFFVSNMNYVNFTPVEMDLRGLPFLEAGDAITLTAQDGTVLNSYILNHTIDGVQHLTQSVESVSGEVIE